MTESDRLGCTNLGFMLEQARSDRKRLLFGVACCRRIWHLLPDDNCRQALVLAEQRAQGHVSAARRNAALALARRALPEDEESAAGQAVSAVCALLEHEWSLHAAYNSAHAVQAALGGRVTLRPSGRALEEQAAQAALLRDLLGYPFTPVWIAPAWLTWNRGAVVPLAQTIYDESAFDQTPILADALDEAGCTVAAILDHLRGPGPRVRGCWVVDLVLEKI
jgi:hypothetical protein